MKLRLDADVMAALRASGDAWQTRINEALRASLALSGKIGKQSAIGLNRVAKGAPAWYRTIALPFKLSINQLIA